MPSILASATRGVVAAMSMSAFRTVTAELGLIKQTPPDAIFREGTPRLLSRVPPERRRAVIELAHWLYGGVGGAVYGFLPEALRRRALPGAVYGLVLWAGFEVALSPMLGLSREKESRPAERAALAADHVLYGWVLSRP